MGGTSRQRSEAEVNADATDTRGTRRHSIRPLVALMAMMMVSRAIHRHHRPVAAAGGPGHRMPPRMAAFLNEWHAQAHQATDPAEPPTA
jgi:hypothetical protein